MATYKTSGIVLGRHNLGEADRIITFMTSDRGKLRAVAKGVRRPLSRQAGHLEPFGEVELMLAEGRNLDIITSARLKAYPAGLTGDYERLQMAYLMARMVERLSGDDQAAPGVYRLLMASLTALERRGVSRTLELFFKLQLLAQLGYRPQLELCGGCGRELAEGYLSPEQGGLLCRDCLVGSEVAIAANGLALWRQIYQATGVPLAAAELETAALATLPICDTFYEYIFGRTFQPA